MKFIEHLEVVREFTHGLIGVSPNLLGPDIFQDRFGLLGVVPEIGLVGDPLFVFDFYAFTIVVKGTSSRQPLWPSRLSIGRLSCEMVKRQR
jgi:hypothetical protein